MGISSHFPAIFVSRFPLPHPVTTLHSPHPVCYARYFPIAPPPHFPRFPPVSPITPPFPPVSPRFPSFAPIRPHFPPSHS